MSNPFSDVDSFEALRAAALAGETEYRRFRRREMASARRSNSRSVELKLAFRIQRMVEVAIASSRAVLLVGPPGTGKTEILDQVISKADSEPARFGFASSGVEASWVTPEEEWTFEKLVLGETVKDGEIHSVEGDLLLAIRNNQWLVLDETNRADMDRVLGGVLTWLSGKRVRVGLWRDSVHDSTPVYLEWAEEAESGLRESDTPAILEYVAGSEWRILGTYNAVDAQRVFRMGQALSRRFKHVPVSPASVEDFRSIIAGRVGDELLLNWFQDRVTLLYSVHLGIEDAQLGPGLFVDIPSYVEEGLRMAAYANAASGEAELTVPPEPGVESDGGGDTSSLNAGTEQSPSDGAPPADYDGDLMEELLAEAYLVSVGNIIVKYEPGLFDELSARVLSLDALTAGNWEWVRQNLHAMRA